MFYCSIPENRDFSHFQIVRKEIFECNYGKISLIICVQIYAIYFLLKKYFSNYFS